MLLGEVLKSFEDEAIAAETLVPLGDIVLLAQAGSAADRHGETLGGYCSVAVQRFAQAASDGDWLALMTALEKTKDPAAACLTAMLRWSLREDAAAAEQESSASSNAACSCGGVCGHDTP